MKVGDLVRWTAFNILDNELDFEFYEERSGLVMDVNHDDNAGPNGAPRYSALILWAGKENPLREYEENMKVIKNESR